MNKLVVSLMLASAALAPSALRADEDRINLWPLVGYNDGALDVIWPLGHFKDSSEWRFFPVIKDGSLFCVFPEFWFGRNEFAVLPLAAKYDFSAGTLFPVWWWDLEKEGKMHTLFPAYYYSSSRYKTMFWAGCGLAGYHHRNGKSASHWLLPLYVKTPDDFLSIPYSRVEKGEGHVTGFLCGLGGVKSNAKGEAMAHWCLPLWHKDETSLFTLPYYRKWDYQGKTMSWVSALALSGGWQEHTTWKERYLLGLCGRSSDEKSGHSESWCAPFYYADNKGTFVTPVYGQFGDAKWGLPGWYSSDTTFASSVWYSHRSEEGNLDQWMIPVLLSGGVYRDGLRKNGFLFNAAGCMKGDDGYFASWCMPLYFKDNDGTFITPLYGYNKDSQWCFPLWYNDEKSLYSALWCQEKNEDGSLKSWIAPPLLSGGTTKEDGSHESLFLLGLGGATWGGKDNVRSSWAFPFYYEDSKGHLVTPLCGYDRDEKASWVAPLYYSDKDAFVSLPYIRERNEDKKETTYVVPPLLSGVTKHDDGSSSLSALALYGHGTDAKGATKHDYLLPLYYYNGVKGNILSLPFGRVSQGSHTNTWWATPLVGTRSGSKTGGWLFPLFNREKDADFEQALARMDAKTIPDDTTFSLKVNGWTNDTGKVHLWTNRIASVDINSSIRGSVLIGSDHDHSVRDYVSDGEHGIYWLIESRKQGNRIFFNLYSDRTVTFDVDSRQRKDETVESETMALCGLYYRTRKDRPMQGKSHARTRILWKLWDREEKNGNVTIDAFPGYTYDSKTNGYTKVSFLWRFFRYEQNPADDSTKLDLLFLPLSR